MALHVRLGISPTNSERARAFGPCSRRPAGTRPMRWESRPSWTRSSARDSSDERLSRPVAIGQADRRARRARERAWPGPTVRSAQGVRLPVRARLAHLVYLDRDPLGARPGW